MMKKRLILSTILLLSVIATQADDRRFAITMRVDSAIASEPQTVYLYSMVERQMQLHDSLAIDSTHREGTMHGTVPYEYNVNILFPRRGPQMAPVVVNNGDSVSIHVGDEDDGFRLRYIDKVQGSPSTLELVRFHQMSDSLRSEYVRQRGKISIYGLSDEARDSIKQVAEQASTGWKRYQMDYALTGKSPYCVIDVASNIFYSHRHNPTLDPFSEEEVDSMMNTLLTRFPDYPPMKAFVNDSTLGSYTSAESFSVWEEFQLRRYSYRFQKDGNDSIVKPLKVGDYMNLPLAGVGSSNINEYRGKYVLVDFWASWCEPCMVQMENIRLAAQMFNEDLQVCMIGMDENRKQWWTAIKEFDLRDKKPETTDRPYTIAHNRAYDDKTGKMYSTIRRLGIKTIPHNYLVDRSGKIIAKNISITLMIDKLKELIAKEQQQ